jgi:hypothetical protein
MFERILRLIHQKVRALEYVMTLHAEEEMNEDELSIFDVEHVLLSGKIVERQRDHRSNDWKYLVQGLTEDNETATVVVKLSTSGRLVIITVYVGR